MIDSTLNFEGLAELAAARIKAMKGTRTGAIILDQFCRIGDQVFMYMEEEARGWGRKDVPDGTPGIVVGFNRYKRSAGHIHEFGRAPGVYERNGPAVIAWANGTNGTSSAGDLFWIDGTIDSESRRVPAYINAFNAPIRVNDLPSTRAWEYDLVQVHRNNRLYDNMADELGWLRVVSVDHDRIGEFCNDGVTPMSIYTVEHPKGNRGTTWLREDEIMKVIRGNVWYWYNDKSKVHFESVEAEAVFAHGMGLVEQIRNPDTKFYTWTINTAVEELRKGNIDSLKMMGGMFGSSPKLAAYKFTDPALGKRVREATVEGFKDHDPAKYAHEEA